MPFQPLPPWSLPVVAAPAFHVVFPALAVGLASYLAVLEGLWLGTRNPAFRNLYVAWARIFAVIFAMALVSSLVLAGPFGADWTGRGDGWPPIAGALLFLAAQAGLAAVMLFGWRTLPAGAHFAAMLATALGAIVYASSVLSAGAWSGAPVGLAPLAQASAPPNLGHPFIGLLLGAYVWTALLVAAASAWRLLKEPEDAESCLALKMAIGMFVITGPLQLVAGELSGGRLLSLKPTALVVLGALPLTVTFDLVAVALGVWGGLLAGRGGLERSRTFLRACVLFGAAGLAATLAGWALAAALLRSFGLLALHGLVLILGAVLIVRLVARGTAGAAEAAS